ncbi:hypothetical protein OAV88_03660 [bacterium]|nr:hypothetical protein [bacterium]
MMRYTLTHESNIFKIFITTTTVHTILLSDTYTNAAAIIPPTHTTMPSSSYPPNQPLFIYTDVSGQMPTIFGGQTRTFDECVCMSPISPRIFFKLSVVCPRNRARSKVSSNYLSSENYPSNIL